MILVDTAVTKNPPANAGDAGDVVWSLGRKILWRRKWQPTSVFLAEKSRGQKSLVGSSPKDDRESDMTQRLHTTIHVLSCLEVLFCLPQAASELEMFFLWKANCLELRTAQLLHILFLREALRKFVYS